MSSQNRQTNPQKNTIKQVEVLISNDRNQSQPQRGYVIQHIQLNINQYKNILKQIKLKSVPSQNDYEVEQPQNIAKGPQINQSQRTTGKVRESAFKESTDNKQFTSSQVQANQGSIYKPQQMTIMKSNEINQANQNKMKKQSVMNKPSIYDNLKPDFAKKRNQQKEEKITQNTNLNDKKELIPGKDERSQAQKEEEASQARSNSQNKTINMHKMRDEKQKQKMNYVPIYNPKINKQESDEYEQQFDDYVEKPNLPIPQKGEIDWKKQQEEQEELEIQQKGQQEKLKREEEEERKKQEKSREEEIRKQEMRNKNNQKYMNLNKNNNQQSVRGYECSLVEIQSNQDKNIISVDNRLNQQDNHQQNFDLIPQLQPIQQQTKGKSNPKQAEYVESDVIKINLNINKTNQAVPIAKVETQQERIKGLRNMVQLEMDAFETLFELQPTTEYEIYINKIKAGTLKNSADQSDDQRVTQDIQVDLFQQNEFGNQYPEDQTRTFLKTNISVSNEQTQTEQQLSTTTKNLDDATKLIEFMNNSYPIFEEILNSEKMVANQNNDNFISEDLRKYPLPKFIVEKFKIKNVRSTLNDGKDTFICYDVIQEQTDWFRISLIIKYTNFRITKYCITQSQVSSLSISNNILIAGTKDGSLNLWDLRETDFSHQKVSNKYIDKIKEGFEKEDINNSAPTSSKSLGNDENQFESNLAFRFPSFTTEYLVQNANLLLNEIDSVQHSSSVVKVLINTKNSSTLEFFSLEEFGKIIVWNLLELSSQEAERNYVEFGKYTKIKVVSICAINLSSQIFMNPESLCFDIQFDAGENHLYICSSLGIIKADKFGTNKIKHPRVFGESHATSFPTCLFVSNESDILIGGYSDGSIKIYSKNFKDPLLTLTNFTKQMIQKIQVNEQTNKATNKRYYDINRFIASDSTGNIFLFDLSVNQSGPLKTFDQITQVNVRQKKAISVQKISERNAVEVFIQDGLNAVNTFKWRQIIISKMKNQNIKIKYSFEEFMEKNLKKIYEDMKKLEKVIPSFYHDFNFSDKSELIK